MPTVFLSYSRDDLPVIEQLAAQLKTHSEISIWRDQEKLYGGQKWPKVLGEAIADQHVFLLAWSKNSATSHFVEFEWTTALALKKKIVPCLLDTTKLPPSLAAMHALPIHDLPKIVTSLTGMIPAGDADRRADVVGKLAEITAINEETVLEAARKLFDQPDWFVQGNVIQGETVHVHYHSDSSRPSHADASERYLKGRVLLIEHNDELRPASWISVTLLQTADSVVTGPEGLFKLSLPDTYHPGIKVELSVEMDGWVIFSPQDGEIIIPALDTELVKLRLVKKGSPKLLSAERIEKFIRDTAEQSKEQVRPEGTPQEIDFSRYIKDWALKSGFTSQQVKNEVDKWIAEAEQKDDPYKLGLAAYAKKNFGEASKLFEESAIGKLHRAREASATVLQLINEAIRDYQLAGDSHTSNYNFVQALMAYRKARSYTSRETQPLAWAELALSIGIAEAELGLHSTGEGICSHLKTAVIEYHEAATVFTKQTFPKPWALIQTNLGAALRELGIRITGNPVPAS
jgi:tetratricopeptide (TPR) repeat protein